MYTVVETYHNEDGSWGNIHHEANTIEESRAIAVSLPETSTVEIWDEDGNTVMPLQWSAEVK